MGQSSARHLGGGRETAAGGTSLRACGGERERRPTAADAAAGRPRRSAPREEGALPATLDEAVRLPRGDVAADVRRGEGAEAHRRGRGRGTSAEISTPCGRPRKYVATDMRRGGEG